MTGETPPNILLVVWDACRRDYAIEHATNLAELASSNVWFENAIAPNPWSLPSHASIFTGEYPHEHGCHRLDGNIKTTLLDELSKIDYTTYGISANGFASQRTGFHKGFDNFRYTGGRELYADGMDISGFAQDYMGGREGSKSDALWEILRQIPHQDNPLKSLTNLSSVALGEAANVLPWLQNIPHPIFAPDSGYLYSPWKNTHAFQSIIEEHDSSSPFFMFMNYMDTHRPYKPRDELQKKHVGEHLNYRELLRLNEEVAYPWEFIDALQKNRLNKEDVEKIRELYAGEIETVDEHLERIIKTLDEFGYLDDTLIIVTSDHGENLGETDKRNKRRMGHEASVSDAVLRVPLMLAHPEIEPWNIEKPVSLKNIYSLILNASLVVETAGDEIRNLLLSDDIVESQYPATGGQRFFEKHPDVPEEIIHHRVSHHSTVVYNQEWKVIAESTGDRWAGNKTGDQDLAEVPTKLVTTAENHLSEFQVTEDDNKFSDEDITQLEALGYM